MGDRDTRMGSSDRASQGSERSASEQRDHNGREQRDHNGREQRDHNGREQRDHNGREQRDHNGREQRDHNGREQRDHNGREQRDYGQQAACAAVEHYEAKVAEAVKVEAAAYAVAAGAGIWGNVPVAALATAAGVYTDHVKEQFQAKAAEAKSECNGSGNQ